MKQDRFLVGILLGIGALILVALGLFFARQDSDGYVADDSPEGVTRNYLLAVTNKDYEKAYGYLADLDHKPTYDEFRRSFFDGSINPDQAGANIGATETKGDEAYVELTVVYAPNDPFSDRWQATEKALLIKQDGKWKLFAMPMGVFWGYEWYREKGK
jgi:hypothetical protein